MKTIIKDYFWITVAAAMTALAVNLFFSSTGLAPGGITGLSIVCSSILHIEVSTMSLCISIPLLILSTIVLGKSFGIKTLYITIASPLFMKVIPSIAITAPLQQIHPIVELIVAGALGGLLVGCAIGIALNHDCATGGTDVIALLIQHVFKFLKLSAILFVLDGSVVITSGIITNSIFISVFSFLSLMVIIQTISFVTKKKWTA
ncbi:MAG: YitT family protein [Merdibacter sp.]|nr:YitT family protein [Merdibacter sp.]